MPTSPGVAFSECNIWFLRVDGGWRQSQWRIWEKTFNLMFCSFGKSVAFWSRFYSAESRGFELIFILLRHKCLLLSRTVSLSILICVCLALFPRDFLYCHNTSFHLPHFSLSTFLRSGVSRHHNHHLAIDSHVNTTKPNNGGENRFVLRLRQ